MPKITIITPCYFNELNIPVYAKCMTENEKIFPSDVTFEYVMIDDGSKDNTWLELEKFHSQYPEKVKIVKLIRNFSSTNAVFAGLEFSTGDCNVIISADLQDPPEIILKMYDHWLKGIKLVLANRNNREEPFLQKLISNTAYKIVQKWGLKNLPKGGFDMNLFDKEIRDILIKMEEKNSFLPFLLMWLGYDFVCVPYTRRKREIGKSTYTLSKKIKSFIDGFVSFTFLPLRIISVAGMTLGLLSLIYVVLIFVKTLIMGVSVEGWTSLMVVLLFVSSFIMIALGIIGEYLYRALDASRNRPNYIIDKKIILTEEEI